MRVGVPGRGIRGRRCRTTAARCSPAASASPAHPRLPICSAVSDPVSATPIRAAIITATCWLLDCQAHQKPREADAERHQGQHRRRERIVRREEHAADVGGVAAMDEEIMLLEEVAAGDADQGCSTLLDGLY
jgi:hypothetical protein